jgi:hypothetical protein
MRASGIDSQTNDTRGMLHRMRRYVRNILTWILGSVIVVIVVAVLGEFFVEVARDKGLYTNAGARWDRLVSATASIATSPWVLYPLIALAGLVGGMWLDTLLRRQEQLRETGKPAPATIENPSAWLEQLADADATQMEYRIFAEEYPPKAIAYPDAPEPYIEVVFYFVNATVFTLTNPRIEGWIRYNGSDLHSRPILMEEDKMIRHAQRSCVTD